MNSDVFWTLIHEARAASGTADEIVIALESSLSALDPSELESFQAWMDAHRYASNRRELWAVAFYIRGGCSDDSFDYFRGWLIAQGREVYLAAMQDPGSLAAHDWPDAHAKYPRVQCELILGVARRAYEAVTGSEMSWDLELPKVPGSDEWPGDRISDYEWTDEDTITLFPALAKRWARD